MTPLFADTSFLIACVSPRDQHFRAALDAIARYGPRFVVTEFVMLEFANTLSGSASRHKAIEFWNLLREDPNAEIVPLSEDLLRRGFDLYARRSDKEWSLTDCISIVVMQDRGLTDALTADRHFEQAGFKALLLA